MIKTRFQPIVDAYTRQRIGYESTMRGIQNQSAEELFRKAELEGTVADLDSLAFAKSAEVGLSILDPDQLLFINVSTVETLKWLVDYDLPGNLTKNRIVIEITEHLHYTEQLSRLLKILTRAGYQIAIDDFGKGQSNWKSLIQLEVTYVKLDIFFVRELHNPTTASVIRNMSALCKDNDIKLIVEGVETKEQQLALLELNTRYMQGHYFGFPASAANVNKYKKRIHASG